MIELKNLLIDRWSDFETSYMQGLNDGKYKIDFDNLMFLIDLTFSAAIKENKHIYSPVYLKEGYEPRMCTNFHTDNDDSIASRIWNEKFWMYSKEVTFYFYDLVNQYEVSVEEVNDLSDLMNVVVYKKGDVHCAITGHLFVKLFNKLYPKRTRKSQEFFDALCSTRQRLKLRTLEIEDIYRDQYFEKRRSVQITINRTKDIIKILDDLYYDFISSDNFLTKSSSIEILPIWREDKKHLIEPIFNFLKTKNLIDTTTELETFMAVFSGLASSSFKKPPIVWTDNYSGSNTNRGLASLHTFLDFLDRQSIIQKNTKSIEFSNVKHCFLNHKGKSGIRIRRQTGGKYKHEDLLEELDEVVRQESDV